MSPSRSRRFVMFRQWPAAHGCAAMAKAEAKAKAKAKKTKPRERLFEWHATLIQGTPARYLGHVHAPDEKWAIAEAAKEFRVPDNLRERIAVMRDNW
jgi:hypothetical protein